MVIREDKVTTCASSLVDRLPQGREASVRWRARESWLVTSAACICNLVTLLVVVGL